MIERSKGWNERDRGRDGHGVLPPSVEMCRFRRHAVVLELEDTCLTAVEMVKHDMPLARTAIMRCHSLPAGSGNQESFRMTGFESEDHHKMDEDQDCRTDMCENCLHAPIAVNIAFPRRTGKGVAGSCLFYAICVLFVVP